MFLMDYVLTKKGYKNLVNNIDTLNYSNYEYILRLGYDETNEFIKDELIINYGYSKDDFDLKKIDSTFNKVSLEVFLNYSHLHLLYDENEFTESIFDNKNKRVILYTFKKVSKDTKIKKINNPSNVNINSYIKNIKNVNLMNNGLIKVYHDFEDENEYHIFKKYYKMKKISPSIIYVLMKGEKYNLDNKKMYNKFSIDNGIKIRDIYAPKEDLKQACRYLLDKMSKVYDKENDIRSKYQFAYKKGKSIKNAVEIHKDYLYTIKTDIVKFFDNCNWNLCKKYFLYLFKEYDNKEFLLKKLKSIFINPETNGLYQGNPMSGLLTNAIMRPVINYLSNIFNKKDAVIGIYADDIAVSSNKNISLKETIKTIEYVFNYYNLPFKLHKEKTKKVKRNGRKIVGIRINHENKMTVTRYKYKMFRSMFDHLSKHKKISIPHTKFAGQINYARYIDETGKIEKLINKYQKIIIDNNLNIPIEKYNDIIYFSDIINFEFDEVDSYE